MGARRQEISGLDVQSDVQASMADMLKKKVGRLARFVRRTNNRQTEFLERRGSSSRGCRTMAQQVVFLSLGTLFIYIILYITPWMEGILLKQ